VSCYPTGGFRKLHRGGGFVTLDVNSPIFVRDDTVYLPACISAYNGYALDENSTLLRAISSITKEGKRLLKLLGREVIMIIALIRHLLVCETFLFEFCT
jgi:glutamine synthetase